jgi:hypothetical protein
LYYVLNIDAEYYYDTGGIKITKYAPIALAFEMYGTYYMCALKTHNPLNIHPFAK